MTSADHLETKVRTCPLSKFEAWDLMVSGYGDHVCHCSEKPNEPGEYGGPGDRPNCYEKDYLSCKWYVKNLVASAQKIL